MITLISTVVPHSQRKSYKTEYGRHLLFQKIFLSPYYVPSTVLISMGNVLVNKMDTVPTCRSLPKIGDDQENIITKPNSCMEPKRSVLVLSFILQMRKLRPKMLSKMVCALGFSIFVIQKSIFVSQSLLKFPDCRTYNKCRY